MFEPEIGELITLTFETVTGLTKMRYECVCRYLGEGDGIIRVSFEPVKEARTWFAYDSIVSIEPAAGEPTLPRKVKSE